MSSSFFESSEEDDELSYTNVAARLKVLKARKPERRKASKKSPVAQVIEDDNTNDPPIEPVATVCPPIAPELIEKEPTTNAESSSIDAFEEPIPVIDDRSSSPPILIADNSFNISNAIEILDSDTDVADVSVDDYVMEVKVRWKSRAIERIKIGKNEKFAKMFQYFATLENVPENQILLTRGEVPVNQHDTPASINLRIIDILEGGIVDAVYAGQLENPEEVCKIKIQSSSSIRQLLTCDLGRSEPFEKLVGFCAKEKNVSPEKIRCFFDGELVSISDTPDSLDLDNEACIDLQIVNS